VPEGVLGRDEIVEHLDAVAELLAGQATPRVVLVVVGGAYLALHGLRESTADVDTVTRIDASIRAAVETVAAQRDLRPNWLNDDALAYAPIGLTAEACEVLHEHPNLLVLGPPADFVFLMKLYAARAPDYDDMVALWPSCTFASAGDAVERFVEAYPHAPHDQHLAEFIAGIARASAAN